jgi:hypothetical protein
MRPNSLLKKSRVPLVAAMALVGLGGCVVAPAYDAGYYAPPPPAVVVRPSVGYYYYGGHRHHHGGHRHWR